MSMHRRRGLSILSLLLVLSLLLAACQPIQPASGTVPAPGTLPAPAESAPTESADALAGAWSGSIAVAGIELAIDVTFTAEGDGYTGSMDIPQQGAVGLPVHTIEVALPAVSFAILDGAQQAGFEGALDESGVLSGAFLQAGEEGSFTLSRTGGAEADATGETAVGAGIDRVFTDPAGFFSVPVPTGWTLEEHPGFVQLTDPEGDMKAYLLTVPTDDLESAIATGWKSVHPDFAAEVRESMTPPSGEGIEATLFIDYRADEGQFIQAIAQLLGGVSYVELYEGSIVGAQRRGAQLQIISSGFKILARERVDLSSQEPGELTGEIVAEWEDFITRAMEALRIPGAAVGVVRGGELVYAQGFGFADPEETTPITPQTHMMIGSTGKSLTTMLMGILVDDGLMTWDTPARDLYPTFAVQDPALSETITMRNLVCACTGVPRRDLELLFNAGELGASDIIASLADFEFFTGFGEAFQYSNQMVASAGYIAASVAEPNAATLEEAYATALAERVTDPLGMENTTLSFEEVIARDNYATPHGYAADGQYVPISLDIERMLKPIGPSGAHWSTLEDMAQYMIAQLSIGVAPDGTRVISEENLLLTRQPQVNISAESSYGLGWMVGTFRGLPMIEHGGNTLGFTSDFGFMPTADLGVIVLANAQGANTLGASARLRLVELLYGLESRIEPSLEFTIEQMRRAEAQLAEQLRTLDAAAVEPFVGDYVSDVLGPLNLALDEGRLYLDVGEFSSELLPKVNDQGEPDGFMMIDPPMAGLGVRIEEIDGVRQVILGEGLVEYTFTPVE